MDCDIGQPRARCHRQGMAALSRCAAAAGVAFPARPNSHRLTRTEPRPARRFLPSRCRGERGRTRMCVRYRIKAKTPNFMISILLLVMAAATGGVVYAQDPKGGPTASAPGAEVYFVGL